MVLQVWVADWVLDEDARVIAVGDELVCWLTFEESTRSDRSPETIQAVTAVAEPLPIWPGGGRHPVRLDVDGAALYWDAPQPVRGRVDLAGRIVWNTVDAPDDFPRTEGIVRRVRMEWSEIVHNQPGRWHRTDRPARYEDVPVSYLPRDERLGKLGVDADSPPAAQSPDNEAASTDAKLFVSLGYPSPRRQPPIGAVRTSWTGVLLDFEPTGLEPS